MKRIALVLLSTVLLSVNTSAWALFGDDEARKAILELRDQLKSCLLYTSDAADE